ncbi:MAG TPA: hypothetical protein VJ724_13305 [Tahibacter sp.]|nr:hypothetical protein [Tahibacter sp.]
MNIVGAPSFIGSGKTVSYVVEVGNYGSNAARETVDFSFNPSGPMTNTNVQCDPASAGACTAYPWRSVDVDLTPGATVRVHVSALFEWPLPPALGERMTFIAYIPSGTIHTNQANDRAEISTSLGVFASGFEME